MSVFIKAFSLCIALAMLAACGGNDASQNGNAGENASNSAKQETYQWKLVTTWPKNFPGLGVAPENFAKLVHRMSSGRLSIKVYAAGEIVPAMEVFSAVSSGTVQMGHGAA